MSDRREGNRAGEREGRKRASERERAMGAARECYKRGEQPQEEAAAAAAAAASARQG